jgi:hypothetical protein
VWSRVNHVNSAGALQQPLVDGLGSRTRGKTELVTEGVAETSIDMESFREVPLSRESFHELAIPGLSKRSDADEPSPGSYGSGQFSAAHSEFCCRIALESSNSNVGEVPADFIDPRSVLTHEHLTFGHEQGHLRWAPRPLPVTLGDGRFRPVHGLGRSFEVDPSRRQVQANRRATLNGICTQRFAELRDQRIECSIDG